MAKTQEELQAVADAVQDRLSGVGKPKLYENITDKDERIHKLEGEVKELTEKFNLMEKTWRNLAKQTVGKEEAEKMGKDIQNG